MNIWTKLIAVPVTNATKQIEAAQLWEVRWYSRYGGYSGDTRPELEAFPSKEAAEYFRDALVNAFSLIKHTSGDKVTLSKVLLGADGRRNVA